MSFCTQVCSSAASTSMAQSVLRHVEKRDHAAADVMARDNAMPTPGAQLTRGSRLAAGPHPNSETVCGLATMI